MSHVAHMKFKTHRELEVTTSNHQHLQNTNMNEYTVGNNKERALPLILSVVQISFINHYLQTHNVQCLF